MNGFILMKNSNIELPRKESFYFSKDDRKRGKGNGHISNERYSHGIHLILKHLKIFIFNTLKKMYYY